MNKFLFVLLILVSIAGSCTKAPASQSPAQVPPSSIPMPAPSETPSPTVPPSPATKPGRAPISVPATPPASASALPSELIPQDKEVSYNLGPVTITTWNPVTIGPLENSTNLYFTVKNNGGQRVTFEFQRMWSPAPGTPGFPNWMSHFLCFFLKRVGF